jgi:hypothetical protein
VEESFAGVKGSTIDIINLPPIEGSTGYADGVKRYLVFADYIGDTKDAYVGGCDRQMIPFPSAGPDLEQLRREKRGQRVAAAYGTLVKTTYEGSNFWDPRDAGVLPGVVLKFQSDRVVVTTKTRSDGTFVVERLPPGTYRIAADLPVGLKLGDTILDEPLEPIEVASDTCFDLTLTAVPTSRIEGRVFGPDGIARKQVSVNLFRADDPNRGMDAWQDDGPFVFTLVPPGDYVLAFGNGKPHSLDPNHPFPDTFYPSAPDFASATVIHLAPGQQIVNADIHLPPGRQTRELEVVLNWNGLRPSDTFGAVVHVGRTEGIPPFPRKVADDRFVANVLPDEVYRVNATASCRRPGLSAAATDTVVVNGADESTPRVTLSFAPGSCRPK